jgi:hypothetical protein
VVERKCSLTSGHLLANSILAGNHGKCVDPPRNIAAKEVSPMLLKLALVEQIYELTTRIARVAFYNENSSLTLRNMMHTLHRDENFTGIFLRCG